MQSVSTTTRAGLSRKSRSITRYPVVVSPAEKARLNALSPVHSSTGIRIRTTCMLSSGCTVLYCESGYVQQRDQASSTCSLVTKAPIVRSCCSDSRLCVGRRRGRWVSVAHSTAVEVRYSSTQYSCTVHVCMLD